MGGGKWKEERVEGKWVTWRRRQGGGGGDGGGGAVVWANLEGGGGVGWGCGGDEMLMGMGLWSVGE